MLRILLLISIGILTSILSNIVSSYANSYTPAMIIAMTGSNSDVRFDVRDALALVSNSGAPALNTSTQNFTGSFYGSGIGWIMFYTGSYQVKLNCAAQPLNNLGLNCTLTGTGWSENIGEVGFAGVQYNPDTGLLEGHATSYMGDISFDGIALPLRPVELTETSTIADHDHTLTVSGAWMYDGSGGFWELVNTEYSTFDFVWKFGSNGIFPNIDLSLASTYSLDITDTNGSITTIDTFEVKPGTHSMSLNGSHYAEVFCTAYPAESSCPDGASRLATTYDQSTGPIIANGINAYQFTLKARDQYGNRTGSGDSWKIPYLATIKNIQPPEDNNFTASMDGDAFNTDLVPGSALFGLATGSLSITSNSLDKQFSIGSNTPTNGGNTIQLQSLIYSGATSTTMIHGPISLYFNPLYITSIDVTNTPVVGIPYTFQMQVTAAESTSIIPDIITTLSVNTSVGGDIRWQDLTSNPSAVCTSLPTGNSTPYCNWDTNDLSTIATLTGSDYSFTGTYKGAVLANPPLEPTTINTYVYYQSGGNDILYQSDNNALGAATRPTQRVRILGQTNSLLNLAGGKNRIDLINTIRKNTLTLSRNRTSYSDLDYTIAGTDLTLGDVDFSNKRTYIVVGKDIFINDSIITPRSHPLTIIALADTNGNGGNITISGSVRDIQSTLIAERAILSETSSGQLYIHGLVSSANAPQETAPTTCPYFIPASSCTPAISSSFDFPAKRGGFLKLTNTTGFTSTGGAIYTAPLIIEADSRLMRDPPEVFMKQE